MIFNIVLFIGLAGTSFKILKSLARETTEITENLDGDFQKANAQFDARVRRRFPAGTQRDKFVQVLREQGFVSNDWGPPDNGYYSATRRENDWMCVYEATVHWQLSKTGTVTSIRGQWGERGCL